ncbi:hypothetical protein C8R46DRAFT_1224001 [Mycena filopes]|nr:hypothetical protein C8R46DRAFT_1224001 [Mycena filopes]
MNASPTPSPAPTASGLSNTSLRLLLADYDLKRQYLALLSSQQVIDICLALDIHVPAVVKHNIWPTNFRAAIASMRHSTSAAVKPKSASTSRLFDPNLAHTVSAEPSSYLHSGPIDTSYWMAPKAIWGWIEEKYRPHSNFRASASQALQKAYKHGRFDKGPNGAYSLNALWVESNAGPPNKRRPKTRYESVPVPATPNCPESRPVMVAVKSEPMPVSLADGVRPMLRSELNLLAIQLQELAKPEAAERDNDEECRAFFDSSVEV